MKPSGGHGRQESVEGHKGFPSVPSVSKSDDVDEKKTARVWPVNRASANFRVTDGDFLAYDCLAERRGTADRRRTASCPLLYTPAGGPSSRTDETN